MLNCLSLLNKTFILYHIVLCVARKTEQIAKFDKIKSRDCWIGEIFKLCVMIEEYLFFYRMLDVPSSVALN